MRMHASTFTKNARPFCSYYVMFILGCCDCPSVYPSYKSAAVTTPFYHPYFYTFYRQQAAWRQSLKGAFIFHYYWL